MSIVIKISELNISKKQIILVVILLVGVILGVILVQREVIFKSRANERVYNTIEVTKPSGDRICEGNRCDTDDLNVNIKINVEDLEKAINEE